MIPRSLPANVAGTAFGPRDPGMVLTVARPRERASGQWWRADSLRTPIARLVGRERLENVPTKSDKFHVLYGHFGAESRENVIPDTFEEGLHILRVYSRYDLQFTARLLSSY